MNLVIVESPAKARTIGKFLGGNYAVEACMGHVRDLPAKRLGVDVSNDFTPTYVIVSGRDKVVKSLRQKTRKMERVYIGTDNDREGEAISWHLKEALDLENGPIRIIFNEITEPSIRKALESPQDISFRKVDAQQARRILDRLVGYMVSPLLWKKVRRGASAGRVQSVALRLICEREDEIKSFVPEEYWTIEAELEQEKGEKFNAKLEKIGKAKAEISKQDEAQKILNDLEGKAFIVESVETKKEERKPLPPLTTSSLQQEASKTFRFRAARTMRIAQQLYEGLDIGKEGTTGLITYMRTDSVRVSEEAQRKSIKFIREKFGGEFVPEKGRKYRSKKGAQEAHEAIRPTDVRREPTSLKDILTDEQMKLYSLIWRRFLASQCKNAVIDAALARIGAGKYEFRASGMKIRFAGFLIVFEDSDEKRKQLPHLSEGETLKLLCIAPQQHFTKPPPRYSEGTLVKALEEKGIGRPSTYAPIISTIQQRDYVGREKSRLFPTNLGVMVNKLLVKNFEDYFNVRFTAGMEAQLDRVEEGKLGWVEVVRDFYKPFELSVQKAAKHMENVKKDLEEETDETCEKCGGRMVIRWGRYGRFLACSNFPKCKNSRRLIVETGVECPRANCGGKVIEKKSKKGRIFYGCSSYPECDFASWLKPRPVKCEKCGAKFLVEKRKGGVETLECVQEGCHYKRSN
jgi:DNA topoisomerase-1